MKQQYYGWFSLKQLLSGNMGVAKYRSMRGHIVTITEVTADDKPSGDFDDFVFLGPVDKLVEPFPTLDLSKSFFRERSKALYEKMKSENDRNDAKLFAVPSMTNDKYRLN